jgi:hypothetical protein
LGHKRSSQDRFAVILPPITWAVSPRRLGLPAQLTQRAKIIGNYPDG